MKLIAKLLSPLLVFVIAQMALIANGIPVPKTHIDTPGSAVNILLPGLLGFGENTALNRAVPYFGTLTGLNFVDELEKRGWETYQADIGPVSSGWDRSCELYALLTGTRVDYGKAHSEKYDHARYGRTYKKPLFKGWGPNRPVNLIGHSFGSNTARMFALLLDQGDAAERKATPKGELSPLFAGGKIDRVYSITTLAGVHNGTTAAGVVSDEHEGEPYLWYAQLLHTMGNNGTINGLYDLQIDHFGMSMPPGYEHDEDQKAKKEAEKAEARKLRRSERKAAEKNKKEADKARAKKFLDSGDHAMYDLSLDGAAAFNKKDKIHPSVYYFSYSSVISKPVGNVHLPRLREFLDPVLFWYSFQIGRNTGWIASPGPEWLENDGLVPLPSALYPKGQKHVDFVPGETAVKPGVWNVMPTVQNADHAYWCGGDVLRHNTKEVFGIYLKLMERLDKTYG